MEVMKETGMKLTFPYNKCRSIIGTNTVFTYVVKIINYTNYGQPRRIALNIFACARTSREDLEYLDLITLQLS